MPGAHTSRFMSSSYLLTCNRGFTGILCTQTCHQQTANVSSFEEQRWKQCREGREGGWLITGILLRVKCKNTELLARVAQCPIRCRRLTSIFRHVSLHLSLAGCRRSSHRSRNHNRHLLCILLHHKTLPAGAHRHVRR